MAAVYGGVDVVAYLVEKMVSAHTITAKDERGRTALHLAAQYDHLDVVAHLVEMEGMLSKSDIIGPR